MENKYDVLIIGAGPAGLTAAIYLARNNVNVALIEAKTPGGKISEQSKIENYPGFNSVSGAELSISMFSQARENGAKFIIGKVMSIENKDELIKLIKLENGLLLESKYLIIATGMQNIIPKEVINIEKFNNKGVSYCVVCDGPLFKDKVCGIIGGGNSAFEEGNYLSSIAKEVHIFVRGDVIRAENIWTEKANNTSNIIFHMNTQVTEVQGNMMGVTGVILNTGENLTLDGLFVAIGSTPITNIVDNLSPQKDGEWCLVVDQRQETTIPGLYAAGDVTTNSNKFRQTIMSAAEGCLAANSIHEDILKITQ